MLHLRTLIRGSAVAIALAVTSLAVSVPRALAEPVLNVIDSGTLEIVPNRPNRMETVIPAIVRIETNRPIRVEVLPAEFRNGPERDPSGTDRVVIVRHGSRQIRSDSGDRTLRIPAGTTELEVLMQIERPRQFSHGSYTYSLNLALTR